MLYFHCYFKRKEWITMAQNFESFKHGVAELLVLHLLSQGDMYGYEITHKFAEKTDGSYTMLEGSLYPILYRLSEQKCISDYTKLVGKRRQRRYYHLEKPGRQRLKALTAEYLAAETSIRQILDLADDAYLALNEKALEK